MDLGIIIDIETTGLDPQHDHIIELGLIQFGMVGGRDPFVVKTYGSLQDPGSPISEEIEKLTGIQNADVAGQQINWPWVNEQLVSSQIMIAHNAAFDRSFLLKVPEIEATMQSAHWACSMQHIDWRRRGYRCRKLNHLAADHGFVNPFAHRALFDCATTLRLIAPYMQELVARSYERMFTLFAVGAAFDKKDLLKARNYRWDGQQKVWWSKLFESELAAEKEFLETDIYNGRNQYVVEETSPWHLESD